MQADVDHVLAQTRVLWTDAGADPADAQVIRRRARNGALVEILPTAHVDRPTWESLRPEHRLAVRSVAGFRRRARRGHALSHLSAAVMYGWAIDGDYPDRVQLAHPGPERSATRTFVVHAGPADLMADRALYERHGVKVTTRARTVADLAASLPFRHGVAITDAALREGVARVDIAEEIERFARRGAPRARRVLDFADGRSANVGESAMRVLFDELRLPAPELQREFRRGGRRAFVDFWFADAGVIVEFDGRGKYTIDGRDPRDSVLAEKDREDWLREFDDVRGFVRIGWRDRRATDVVAAKLGRRGVVPVRSRKRSSLAAEDRER